MGEAGADPGAKSSSRKSGLLVVSPLQVSEFRRRSESVVNPNSEMGLQDSDILKRNLNGKEIKD
ncbi:hypothetical protein Hanom_Chr06g00541311 [Helianthus anomalus]